MWGLKGITVKLKKQTVTGHDSFGADVISTSDVDVDDVLVYPASEQEILDTLNLYGKKAVYVLCIPKGDTNDWENTTVTFFGETWRTISKPIEYIESMTPLRWNKKVKVESIV